MKKSIALLLVFVLLILGLFTGCSATRSSSETISSQSVKEVVGNYFLYKTKDANEYLNFLEHFDENRYEIVDISTSMLTVDDSEFYMITYRVKNTE